MSLPNIKNEPIDAHIKTESPTAQDQSHLEATPAATAPAALKKGKKAEKRRVKGTYVLPVESLAPTIL